MVFMAGLCEDPHFHMSSDQPLKLEHQYPENSKENTCPFGNYGKWAFARLVTEEFRKSWSLMGSFYMDRAGTTFPLRNIKSFYVSTMDLSTDLKILGVTKGCIGT